MTTSTDIPAAEPTPADDDGHAAAVSSDVHTAAAERKPVWVAEHLAVAAESAATTAAESVPTYQVTVTTTTTHNLTAAEFAKWKRDRDNGIAGVSIRGRILTAHNVATTRYNAARTESYTALDSNVTADTEDYATLIADASVNLGIAADRNNDEHARKLAAHRASLRASRAYRNANAAAERANAERIRAAAGDLLTALRWSL